MVSFLLILGLMVTLFVAGIAKGIDPSEFASELSSWRIIPAWAAPPVAIALPAMEVGVPLSWISARSRRKWVIVAAAMLSCTTLVYALEWSVNDPPRCECFGLLSRYHAFEARANGMVIRNLILVLLLTAGALLMSNTRGTQSKEIGDEVS